MRREKLEFWIALQSRQSLGLRDEMGKGGVVGRDGRLDIVVRQRIGSSVEDAIFEVLLGLMDAILRWPFLDITVGARRAFEIGGRGCLVRLGEDEPTYATVTEIAVRLEPHADATMLLTAVSEAVERYDPATEAVILLETESGFQVLILSPEGYDYVGGLTFEGDGLLGPARA